MGARYLGSFFLGESSDRQSGKAQLASSSIFVGAAKGSIFVGADKGSIFVGGAKGVSAALRIVVCTASLLDWVDINVWSTTAPR